MERRIKKEIVEVARLMYDKGFANTYEGNVSVLYDGKVFITPSAVSKALLTEDMLVVTDTQGNVLEGEYKPSSEIKLHLAAYRYRDDIASVVHAHPPYSTAFALANKAIESKAHPELVVLYDSIPLARYGTPSTDEIYQGMEEYIQDHDIILLANHGIVALGKSTYDSFTKLESAESIAKTYVLAQLLGGVKDLPKNKLEELYRLREKRKG
ncbi:MAG: class II aldolase/adducin family protein [Mahellales bacterium]